MDSKLKDGDSSYRKTSVTAGPQSIKRTKKSSKIVRVSSKLFCFKGIAAWK